MAEARTEEASPQKLAQARERGEVPVSRTLTAAAAVTAFALVASLHADEVVQSLRASVQAAFVAAPSSELKGALALTAAARLVVELALPALLAAFVAALVVGLAQSGGLWAPSARGALDPLARLRGSFGAERALDALSAGVIGAVLLATAWSVCAPSLPGILALADGDLPRALRLLGALARALFVRLCIAALVLGALDLLVRRVRHRMRLRMSWREQRDEQREQYGDPLLRAERMRRARGSNTRGKA